MAKPGQFQKGNTANRGHEFKTGNQAALKHGGRSRVAIEKRSNEIRAELSDLLGEHLDLAPADMPLLDVAVDVALKLRLMNEYFSRTSSGSLIDGRGRPRGAADTYLQVMRLAISIFDRLGIGPASRAKILGGVGPSLSLAGQLAQRRSANAALEAHKE